MPTKISRWLFRRSAYARPRRADQARGRGDWATAARLYRAVLDRRPQLMPIWVQYGHALKESGNRPAAELAYRRAIAEDGGIADTHLQLGHVLKLQGRQNEAAGAYFTAHVLDRELADPRAELTRLGYSPIGAEAERWEERLRGAERAQEQARELLQLQLYSLRGELRRAINRSAELAAGLRESEAANEALASSKRLIEGDLAAAKTEFDDRRARWEADRDALDDAVRQRDRLIGENESLRAEHSQLERVGQAMRLALTEAAMTNDALGDEILAAQAARDVVQSELAEQRHRFAEATARIEALDAALDAATRNYRTLAAEMDELRAQLVATSEQADQLKQANAAAHTALDAAGQERADVEELRAQLAAASEQADQLKQVRAELEMRRSEMAEIAGLRSDLSAALERADQARAEVAERRRQADEAELKLEALEEFARNALEVAGRERETLAIEAEALRAELATAKAERSDHANLAGPGGVRRVSLGLASGE